MRKKTEDPKVNLERAMNQFERDYPDVAQAIMVMNISFEEYLKALAALQAQQSVSGNATTPMA
jgi:hypothetical protein